MRKEITIPDGTPEEQAMYRSIAKKFGLKLAKIIEPIPGAVKVIRNECFCSLCETTSVKYIRLIKYTDNVWKRDKEITEEEAKNVFYKEERFDRVSTCECCLEFLMSKSKMELAKMIMRIRSPILTNIAVKKVLQKMRELEESKDVDLNNS